MALGADTPPDAAALPIVIGDAIWTPFHEFGASDQVDGHLTANADEVQLDVWATKGASFAAEVDDQAAAARAEAAWADGAVATTTIGVRCLLVPVSTLDRAVVEEALRRYLA